MRGSSLACWKPRRVARGPSSRQNTSATGLRSLGINTIQLGASGARRCISATITSAARGPAAVSCSSGRIHSEISGL